MTNHLLTLHTLSPLHCGIGQAVGAIELPIAREKPTHIPIVPGSSIKGVLRAQEQDIDKRQKAFGPDTKEASLHAGAIQFSDARLVLLPMRSVKGVFAWTTSPYLLDRLRWDMQEVGCKSWGKTPVVEGTDCLLAQPTALLHEGKVYLDDLDFTARKDMEGTQKVATTLGTLFFPGETDRADFLTQHLCIVPDDVMTLLLETGTELQTHVCLDSDTKTVKSGQLWQEESLPVESLLVALVQVNPEQNSGASKDPTGSQKELDMHLRNLCTREGRKATLQFGGKSTVGKGLCQVGLVGKE